MSIESMMPSNHLILCHSLLLSPSIFPSIGVFSSESSLHIRWPKYWSFSFNISPSNEYSGLISFRMDWLDLLVVQGTLKSLLQHHSSKVSILQRSAFFITKKLKLFSVLLPPKSDLPLGVKAFMWKQWWLTRKRKVCSEESVRKKSTVSRNCSPRKGPPGKTRSAQTWTRWAQSPSLLNLLPGHVSPASYLRQVSLGPKERVQRPSSE